MAFAAIFSVLSGWAASIAVWRKRGWHFILLGLLACYGLMVIFMFLQLNLLDMIGIEKTQAVIVQSSFLLAAGTCFIWGPAFAIFYLRNAGEPAK